MAADSKVVFTRVSPEFHDLVAKAARVEDRSISSLTRQALLHYFDARGVFEAAAELDKATEGEGEEQQWPDWMGAGTP